MERACASDEAQHKKRFGKEIAERAIKTESHFSSYPTAFTASPACGGFLVKRKSKNGHWFSGCTNYPYYEYTEEL